MKTIKTIVLLGLSTVMPGCGGSTPEPETPEATEPDTTYTARSTQNVEAETTPASTEAPAVEEKEEVNPFAQIVADCESVQRAADLPISCKINADSNVVRMQIVMEDRVAAAQYFKAAVSRLAGPFCRLANSESVPAAVVVASYQERMMRAASCQDGRFSDWKPIDPEVQEFNSAQRACQALQASPYSVGCSMALVEDKPSLIVAYGRSQMSEAGLAFIDENVATPFCDATTRAGIRATVYVVEDQRRAQAIDCATHARSPWMGIQRDTAPRPPSHHRSPVPVRDVYHLASLNGGGR